MVSDFNFHFSAPTIYHLHPLNAKTNNMVIMHMLENAGELSPHW